VHSIDSPTKGGSAGHLPSQVNKMKSPTNNQNITRRKGEKTTPPTVVTLKKGKTNKQAMDRTKPITPPNLLGIERRIA